MGTKFGPSADIDWPVMRWYLALIAVAFIALIARLLWLQVLGGSEHRLASLGNIIRGTEIPGPRGDIYDRAGKPLAKSVNVYGLLYVPPRDIEDYLPDAEQRARLEESGGEHRYLSTETGERLAEIEQLAEYLGTAYEQLMLRVESERRRSYGFQPLLLVDELDQQQVIELEERQADYPGVLIERFAFKRSYPLGELAAHLVGYVGQLSDSDPESIQALGYGPREQVGKEGIERTYEQLVHGIAGQRDIELRGGRNAADDGEDDPRVIEGIANEVPPRKGTAIYLTVHKETQARASALLAGRPGAIVVSCLADGHEGEILALASSPAYDPNRFAEEGYYTSLLERPDGSVNEARPLLNRAYRNAFPPGSTFKLVTAAAAIQEGVASPGSGYTCRGYIEVGRNKRRYHCHNRNGHGNLTFIEGISESCDVVFYRLGQALGSGAPETLKRYGGYFGYGEPVGIDLPGEARGLLPDKDWKRQNYAWANEVDRLWYDGDTLNYVIGQGFVTATPLQVLWSATLVATDGWWYPPRLLKGKVVAGRVENVDRRGLTLRTAADGSRILPADEQPVRRPISDAALSALRRGMRLAVIDGTCERLDLDGMYVCAKTGTAETGIEDEDDHAWVCGYYPYQDPQYAFVVFFQNGGSAGETAVPAAAELLRFIRDNPPLAAAEDDGA